jgi:addiction module HigA family antidote
MLPRHRIPASPGEILLEEFLRPLGITQTALAKHIGVPIRRINEIVRGRRAVSPETAQLLAAALGTSAEFWMAAQSSYDLATHRIDTKIRPLAEARI